MIRTANADDKAALVEADGPFFTIDHFRSYNAVLVQQSRLGEVDVDELREVLTDAWLAVAPRGRWPKKFLAGLDSCSTGDLTADPARRAAFEVLKAVRVKGAYTNLVLPHQLGKYRLTGRDAAFATELASGTIRRQGTYDAILAACTDRPLANTAAKVLDVLRLGCHQLLGMRVRAARGDQHQRRPGALRGPGRARPASPTRCCARSRPTTSRPG